MGKPVMAKKNHRTIRDMKDMAHGKLVKYQVPAGRDRDGNQLYRSTVGRVVMRSSLTDAWVVSELDTFRCRLVSIQNFVPGRE